MTNQLYDKHGIPFERGDIVKVFHFVGARGKRNYMYKQCLGPEMLHPSHEKPYMMFSHLNFVTDRHVRDGPYHETIDGRKLTDYEIVQSIKCDHEERKKKMSNYQIPFCAKTGDLLHHPDDGNFTGTVWKDNSIFWARLHFAGYRRGRSAAYLVFEDSDGREFNVFLADFVDMVPKLDKGIIKGDFTFCKRGQNYGLKLP